MSDEKESKKTETDGGDPARGEPDLGSAAAAGSPEDDTIIDAEVIAETPAPRSESGSGFGPDISSFGSAGQPGDKSKPKGGFAAKAGWGLSGLLAAFCAGVYFAPQFADGMVALGLKDAPIASLVPSGTDSAQQERQAMRQQQENQGKTLDALAALVQQHEDALTDAETKREKLANDIRLMAAQNTGALPATDPAALNSLRAEIERLTVDVARLSALAGSEDPSVAQLTGALALARAETSQLKARLAAVEESMKAVEAGALEASPRGRLVLSLGRLRDRALAGQPFGQELSALRTDFALLPAIDQQIIGADLAVLEENGAGVQPYETLVRDFDAVAAAAVQAEDKAEGGFLTGLFTSRRTDAGASGLDAVLLKAERRLLARDVPGALDALDGLEGPVLAATEAWRAAAKRYVDVSHAFDRLIDRVANRSGNRQAETGS